MAGETVASGGEAADIAERPNEAADTADVMARYVPADVLARYEVYSYRNAALILSQAHPAEFAELYRLNARAERKLPGAGDRHPARMRRGLGGTAMTIDAALDFAHAMRGKRFATILADPPWRFQNRTGKMAPEHRRLARYGTMTLDEICALPVEGVAADPAHLYLWVPNALLPEGLTVMKAWGFEYKSNLVWHKIRKDGGSDGRGVGFYFRNVTELCLFGVRGKNARTLPPGRTQVNLLGTRKREHSRKPDEAYDIIEACSPGPRLEMFARGERKGWTAWGDQADAYEIGWETYAHNSRREGAAEWIEAAE